MITTKEITITLSNKNKNHYLPKYSNITGKIVIPIEDLYVGASNKVDCICDYCNQDFIRKYNSIIRGRQIIQKDACEKCSHKKSVEAKRVNSYAKISQINIDEDNIGPIHSKACLNTDILSLSDPMIWDLNTQTIGNYNDFSYFYGLLLTDGYLKIHDKISRGFGIELNEKDKSILEILSSKFPKGNLRNRIRNTNFKDNYKSYIFDYYDTNFSNYLLSIGFPQNNKTSNACLPNIRLKWSHFWRGVIDGDGCVIKRKTGNQYKLLIQLTTQSESLRDAFIELHENFSDIVSDPQRNERDGIYNIGYAGKVAKDMLTFLYQDKGDLFIPRKFEVYQNCDQKGIFYE